MSGHIIFTQLNPDGTTEEITRLPVEAVKVCPHFILEPTHYRPDQTCRCDDVNHHEMAEWGYKWRNGLWI